MARIVLGMGSSHTPMLNAPPTDWPRFIERDSQRTNLLDVEGPERQRVRPRGAPAPREQNRVRDAQAGAGLVLPDAGPVEGLAAVDEHTRVPRLAAGLSERAEERDRLAGERDQRRHASHVVGHEVRARP